MTATRNLKIKVLDGPMAGEYQYFINLPKTIVLPEKNEEGRAKVFHDYKRDGKTRKYLHSLFCPCHKGVLDAVGHRGGNGGLDGYKL